MANLAQRGHCSQGLPGKLAVGGWDPRKILNRIGSESSEAELKKEKKSKLKLGLDKGGHLDVRGGDWARIGTRCWGRSLRGRVRVGSQRSVNSGDVMRARWRKGEPVVSLSGVGAWVLPGLGH